MDNVNTIPVVEITVTTKIDGIYFLRNHQYEYVSSLVKDIPEGSDSKYQKEEYHIVLRDGIEYHIPSSVSVITTALKTELEQNMVKYIEVTRRDNIVRRNEAYFRSLPIAETKYSFGKPNHTGEAYKRYLLRKKGSV